MGAPVATQTNLRRRLATVYASNWSSGVRELLLSPSGMGTTHTLEDALEIVGDLGERYLPLAVVDESSLAVVDLDEDEPTGGLVLRLFLGDVHPRHQLAVLDLDPLVYVASLEEEVEAREIGLTRILDEVGPAYETAYLQREKRPRDFVVRPVRIACQNVIVGLAAIAQDSSFDGLSVVVWQTCEVPHVATHEGNRALAALMLCDAFQNGGTMEIRFDRPASVSVANRVISYDGHPEGRVPSSLRRFGRTVGVSLGAEDAAAITPAESRQLFLAVTPMPPELRSRVEEAVALRGIAPERLCFTLMSQTWREIELDFLLACSRRAGAILQGGSEWEQRIARQSEMDVARCALMAGMFYRRLNGTDSAGGEEVRVAEDRSRGVLWSIHEDDGSVEFSGLQSEPPPWSRTRDRVHGGRMVVLPRSAVTAAAVSQVQARQRDCQAALALPRDAVVPPDIEVPILQCPDRLADLDRAVEAKLLTSRISRG